MNTELQIRQPPRPPALAALRAAYLRSGAGDSPEALDVLLVEQPDCVPAHLLKIGRAVVAKDLAAFPALERALREAEPYLARASEHERRHAAAARLWLAHRPLHAAHVYSTISANDPHDLLALRLAQSSWFFLGRRRKVHEVAQQALRAWAPSDEGYDIALAMLAFGCDEAGDAARAEDLAARSLAIEPRHPFAIHALAHALGTRKSAGAVARFLRGQAVHWRIGGRLDSHIAWHLAVAELESGETSAAAVALADELAPLAADGSSAAADATDLAWRLELAGVEIPWDGLADAWARHPAGFWPPYDVLAGIAYERAGRAERAGSLRRTLADGPYLRPCSLRAARKVTLPALTAIEAFSRGAYATAESHLRATIAGMEGSLPQRELFELTLRASRRERAPSARPQAALRIPA